MVNIGARPAYERIAQLLCELATRMRAVGLLPDLDGIGPFHLPPITQSNLGDATGLSMVHVNRTLQRMRRDGLVSLDGRNIVVLDWDKVSQVAGLESTYLQS